LVYVFDTWLLRTQSDPPSSRRAAARKTPTSSEARKKHHQLPNFSSSNSSSTHSILGSAGSEPMGNLVPADPKHHRVAATSRSTQTGEDSFTLTTNITPPDPIIRGNASRFKSTSAVNGHSAGTLKSGQQDRTVHSRLEPSANDSTPNRKLSSTFPPPRLGVQQGLKGSRGSNLKVDEAAEGQLLVKSIDYSKTTNQLVKNPNSRTSALLLQSLRQQLTRAPTVKQSNLVMGVFAENDLLSLKIRKNVTLSIDN